MDDKEMKPVLKVILVEDEEANIESWKARVDAHNVDEENIKFIIDSVYARSASEARKALLQHKADAIVVDLRLRTGADAGPNDHGNSVVKYTYESHPVAIAVYSGQRQEADVSSFKQVEVFDRGAGLEPVLEWLAKQQDMLCHLQDLRKSVERETAKVFFSSVWPRWSRWIGSDDAIRDMLFRHVVAHIHDTLLNSNDGVSHPEETYFVPPIKSRFDTGDIVDFDNGKWIVVTPRCDLANPGKAASLLLARCESIADRWENAGTKERAKITQHDGGAKNHFLPIMVNESGVSSGPWFVKFGDLKVLSLNEGAGITIENRCASLTPQFVPSLVERFGAYFARIGTPVVSQG